MFICLVKSSLRRVSTNYKIVAAYKYSEHKNKITSSPVFKPTPNKVTPTPINKTSFLVYPKGTCNIRNVMPQHYDIVFLCRIENINLEACNKKFLWEKYNRVNMIAAKCWCSGRLIVSQRSFHSGRSCLIL